MYRNGEFNGDSFYCAACSVWFLVEPKSNPSSVYTTRIGGKGTHAFKLNDNELQCTKPQTLQSSPPSTTSSIPLNAFPDDNKGFSGNQQQAIIYTTRNHTNHQTVVSQFPPGIQYPSTVAYPPNSNPKGQLGVKGAPSGPALHVAPDGTDSPPPGGSSNTFVPTEVRHMKTPREIMKGLDEYVIGQRNVKITLAVGVYNHYKRIFVAEAYPQTDSQQTGATNVADQQHDYDVVRPMTDPSNTPSIANLNLEQFGSSYIGPATPAMANERVKEQLQPSAVTSGTHFHVDGKTGTSIPNVSAISPEPPSLSSESAASDTSADNIHTNSIENPNFGRDIEDCEIEKSNIMLLGPTGSGKVRMIDLRASLKLLAMFPRIVSTLLTVL
jgi:hypothetical protein